MNNSTLNASVIVSFYNNVEALQCIIRSLESQKDRFEVIIADDGSKLENVKLVSQLIDKSTLSITHVWQKDEGFRKNRILNKAVKAAKSEYIIIIDGDCIPQQHFVSDHIKNREHGYILNARRVDLATSFKEALYRSSNPADFFNNNLGKILVRYLTGEGKNVEKGIRITNSALSKFLNRKNKGVVGCNFSLFKEDLLTVNGFDNRYDVPGVGEDTDIEYRLVKNGMKIKNIFYKAVVLHPIHPELTRVQRAQDLFAETLENDQIIALDGYQQAEQKD